MTVSECLTLGLHPHRTEDGKVISFKLAKGDARTFRPDGDSGCVIIWGRRRLVKEAVE